jgi:hypothetical protein
MSNVPAVPKAKKVLDFVWVDGRGHRQKMAKFIAQQSADSFQEKTLDGMTLIRARFAEAKFVFAHEVFDLIGRYKTTRITVPGVPTINKFSIESMLSCYVTFLRSRARDYCGVMVCYPKPVSGFTIGIDVSSFGIHTKKGEQPAKRRKKPFRYACRRCHYSAEHAEPKEMHTRLMELAVENHVVLCPAFARSVERTLRQENF